MLKLLAEEDYKRLHAVALAVESARAVSCTTISDECNLYGKILNRIVFATQTGPISDSEKIIIFKMVNEMDDEFRKGQEMIEKQWAEYIKVSNAEVSK